MSAVVQADNTYVYIKDRVRRLTGSPFESQLTTSEIDQKTNSFITGDFAYAIKLDQMRTVYTFYTAPYVEKYPVNVNYIQGCREPFEVDGIRGFFYKDRTQFYNLFPRYPTQFQPISGDGITQVFNFTIGGTPFLPNYVTLGGSSTTGEPIQVSDDGNGNLYLQTENPVVSIPAKNTYPAIPGMYNQNTGNPGLNNPQYVGTVDYQTGSFSVNFTTVGVTPEAGQNMNLFVSQYWPARPYAMLFWNNEITIRPIPKLVHKCTFEAYLTPVQFMQTTDSPILYQWKDYISLGVAIKVLEDRQDVEGIANLAPLFDRQEGLVLERQAVEEIGQRNATIFSGTNQIPGWNNWWGGAIY